MSLALFKFLVVKSAGVGLGIFLGALLGLSVRKSRGNKEGLLAGSVIATSFVFGLAAMAVFMLITYLRF